MRTTTRRLTIVAIVSICGVVVAPPAWAQAPLIHAGSVEAAVARVIVSSGTSPLAGPDLAAQWARVRALAAGHRVSVDTDQSLGVTGTIEAVTGDAIVIRTKSGRQELNRDTVIRVRVSSLTKRLVYGAIGVTAGAAGGYLVCPYCANEGSPSTARNLVIAGAAIGSLLFLPDYQTTLYQRPKPRHSS